MADKSRFAGARFQGLEVRRDRIDLLLSGDKTRNKLYLG